MYLIVTNNKKLISMSDHVVKIITINKLLDSLQSNAKKRSNSSDTNVQGWCGGILWDIFIVIIKF